MFAIITFRKAGPIKTWSAMRATNVHNARTKPLDHSVPGAPGPRHLIGGRDLVADVKAQLRLTKIDPHRLRKNGVIAYEAIMTASAEFFESGTEEDRRARLETWTQAQVAWAKERYGMLRIASMVLHQDEKTPHIHLVVLPFELKVDKRRTDQRTRWSLIGRTISGPGRFDEVQDAYAAAMAPFELVRGVRGSGRKHEPVPVYLARLAAKEQEVDTAKAALSIDTASLAVERAVLDAKTEELERARRDHAAASEQQARDDNERRQRLEWDRHAMLSLVAAQRREVAAAKAVLEKEKAEHAAYIAAAEQRMAADRNAVRCQEAASIALRDRLAEAVATQRRDTVAANRALEAATALLNEAEQDRVAASADRANARAMTENVEAHHMQLLPTMRAAADFRMKIASLKGQSLTQTASATQAAMCDLTTAMSSAVPPHGEARPKTIAFYEHIRQAGASLR